MKTWKIIGSVIVFLVTTIVGPILVALLTGGVQPDSPLGRYISALYPTGIAERVVQQPMTSAVIPDTALPAPTMTTASPPVAAQVPGGIAMTATPKAGPFTVQIGQPVLQNSRHVAVTLYLTSAIDALPTFVSNESGMAAEWRAGIEAAGVTCSVYASDLRRLRTFQGTEWRQAGPDMTVLPGGQPYPVEANFSCDGDLNDGQPVTVTARFDYLNNGAQTPVRVVSPAIPLVKR